MYVEKKSPGKKRRNALIVLLVVVACVVILFQSISMLKSHQLKQQQEELRKTILSLCVQCYAIEGVYPANVTYLEESYGLIINHDKFIVSYEAYSANLLPEVKVLVKGE